MSNFSHSFSISFSPILTVMPSLLLFSKWQLSGILFNILLWNHWNKTVGASSNDIISNNIWPFIIHITCNICITYDEKILWLPYEMYCFRQSCFKISKKIRFKFMSRNPKGKIIHNTVNSCGNNESAKLRGLNG